MMKKCFAFKDPAEETEDSAIGLNEVSSLTASVNSLQNNDAQVNGTRYSPTETEIEMERVGEHETRERAMSFFQDGHKTVDFIIVNDPTKEEHEKEAEYRQYYEDNLREEGLELEETENNTSRLRYIKIHAPWDVLSRYAEIMKLKMPMKHVENAEKVILDEDDPFCIERFTIPYTRDKEYLFNIPEEKEKFFSTSQRAHIIDFVLRRKHFCPRVDDASAFGINKLIQDGVYCAAYPLHDGKLTEGADPHSPRMNLSTNWASLSKLFRPQPLDEVKSYFGVKVALYFAWLGFYTKMLIPASIVGVICFFYGLVTVSSDVPSQQICDHTFDATPMCPLCVMQTCKFWNISKSCKHSRMSYVFDNPATVFFAVFMSLWSTVYLEMWKRYSAKITFRWDLSAFDSIEQVPRPEYLASLSKTEQKKLNEITKMYEPYLPFWRRQLPYTVLSGVSVLLLILVAFSALIGVIIYRVSVSAALAANADPGVARYSSIITSATAAFINLICIMILNQFYTRLAFRLTELEMPRTQTDFDNSLTLKMYLLQFVNFYSSIFYIAFFKGRFIGYPGDLIDNNSFLSKRTQEACGTGGCFVELTIQLAIIMIGKQALNAIMEMVNPWVQSLLHRWSLGDTNETDFQNAPQWEADYVLAMWKPQALFYEYLEMVLQFGFVTIFVAAFPLAPVFAIINNVFEIRLDAKKMIGQMRRPVAKRVKDIGVWYGILEVIGRLAVLSNALIIAFTSDFIPRIYHYAKFGSMETYVNETLSFYESKEFDKFHIAPVSSKWCMYLGNRYPPNAGDDRYKPTTVYWEELAVKFAFVVIFENIIAGITMILAWAIPDIPASLKRQIKQHEYMTNELIMHTEVERSKVTQNDKSD